MRFERVALLDELFTLFLIILDDTVMYCNHVAVIRRMRMCIDCRRLTVRRPACMTDAAGALNRLAMIGHFGKDFELAFFLDDLCFLFAIANSNTGRVIASVFKFCKSVQKDWGCWFCSCESYNSTHEIILQILTIE